MTFPNASTIQNTQGLVTAQSIQNTFGLEPANIQGPDNSVAYIQPALIPPISNAQPGYQVVLSNQLAGQMAKLFQQLFPITADPDTQFNDLTNPDVLLNNQQELLTTIQQMKMTVLTINQITNQATSRIPNGFQTPNTDTATEAGLSTDTNNNPVLNDLDNLWRDINDQAWQAAQNDYATLRGRLRPYFNL